MTTYFLETDIQFPNDIIDLVSKIALEQPENLVERERTWRKIYTGMPYSEMEKILGIRQTREIRKRHALMAKMWPNGEQISFCQYSLPKDIEDAFIDACPQWMKEIRGRDELIPIVQIGSSGNILYPHRGHLRHASIFYLLAGSNEITRWWDPTADFELIDEYRIPDMSKLKISYEACIQKNVWSVFNHAAWHSVHTSNEKTKYDIRVNIGIDFKTLTIEEFEPILKANSRVIVPENLYKK